MAATTPLLTVLDAVHHGLRSAGDAERAEQMAAYMKGHFAFVGVPSPLRKSIQKPLIAACRTAEPDAILTVADACWRIDARELQYVGADALRAGARSLRAPDLGPIRDLVVTKSWWDTVDALAAHVVGPMVQTHAELTAAMDRWIDDDDIWVARTAILHQLTYKDRTDRDRLFAYAIARGGDTKFFIRKALGWALRTYARVAPDEVRTFVADHEHDLSGLTKREALKNL